MTPGAAPVEKDYEVTPSHVPRSLVGARCAGTPATIGGQEAWTCDIPWGEREFLRPGAAGISLFRRPARNARCGERGSLPDHRGRDNSRAVKEAAFRITVGGATAVR